jgi:hypothetical protein
MECSDADVLEDFFASHPWVIALVDNFLRGSKSALAPATLRAMFPGLPPDEAKARLRILSCDLFSSLDIGAALNDNDDEEEGGVHLPRVGARLDEWRPVMEQEGRAGRPLKVGAAVVEGLRATAEAPRAGIPAPPLFTLPPQPLGTHPWAELFDGAEKLLAQASSGAGAGGPPLAPWQRMGGAQQQRAGGTTGGGGAGVGLARGAAFLDDEAGAAEQPRGGGGGGAGGDGGAGGGGRPPAPQQRVGVSTRGGGGRGGGGARRGAAAAAAAAARGDAPAGPAPAAHQQAAELTPVVYQQQLRDYALELALLTEPQFATLLANFNVQNAGAFLHRIFAGEPLPLQLFFLLVVAAGGAAALSLPGGGLSWDFVVQRLAAAQGRVVDVVDAPTKLRRHYALALRDFEEYVAIGEYARDVEARCAPPHDRLVDADAVSQARVRQPAQRDGPDAPLLTEYMRRNGGHAYKCWRCKEDALVYACPETRSTSTIGVDQALRGCCASCRVTVWSEPDGSGYVVPDKAFLRVHLDSGHQLCSGMWEAEVTGRLWAALQAARQAARPAADQAAPPRRRRRRRR